MLLLVLAISPGCLCPGPPPGCNFHFGLGVIDFNCSSARKCPGGTIADCDGRELCSDYLGDGICDDGGASVSFFGSGSGVGDFNCEGFEFDRGDCPPPEEPETPDWENDDDDSGVDPLACLHNLDCAPT